MSWWSILSTVVQAIDQMLSSGAKSVIITSTELETAKNKLVLLAKNRNGEFPRYILVLLAKNKNGEFHATSLTG